jgi:protein PhnA
VENARVKFMTKITKFFTLKQRCSLYALKYLYIYTCKKNTMSELSPCPKCNCEYTYEQDAHLVCPECFHEWTPEKAREEVMSTNGVIKDANGNELKDGDTVIVIKDLPVKGAPKPVKAGTKVKNIKLVEGDHDISCRIDGFGAMGLKSQFVRKA